MITTLILQYNMSYPSHSYRDLVFPSFKVPAADALQIANLSVEADIPALRTVLSNDRS